MKVISTHADGQADVVRWARLGRDRSLLIELVCGSRLQLSVEQAAILKSLEATGEMRPRDLYAVICRASFGPAVIASDGPVTSAQRASLSRAIRRLDEQSLIYRPSRTSIAVAWTGSAIAKFLVARDSLLRNVNRGRFIAPLLTLPLSGSNDCSSANVELREGAA